MTGRRCSPPPRRCSRKQPGCPRRLEEHHTARRARDRRDLRRRSFQGAVVHRSAQHQPQQRRPGGGEAADRPVDGCIRPGRHPHHTEPGFRGREKRRSAGAAGASHEVIRFGSRREAIHELVRVGNRRDRKMVCQSSIRGHHAFVFCASGGGATGHHTHRLHRGENGGRAVLRSAPAALRRAQADHHFRSLFTRSGGGPETDGYRGHLPGRLGHVGQGIRDGGPGTRPGQLSALPGARRGCADRARPAHGGPEPALRPLAPERVAACCLPRDRLSAIHHRRRRHGTRRRRARPESGPSFRRGRGPGLPHRGPEARRQEVRAPGGKVLVGVDEQIKRLSAARFQLDVMKVPGVVVARTDAEAATFLEGRGDERDHPFILGATNVELPTYKVGYLAILRKLRELGVDDARGHLLFEISAAEYDQASAWLARTGVMRVLEESEKAFQQAEGSSFDALLETVEARYLEVWLSEANLKSYPKAVADVIEFRANEGERFDVSADEWLAFANRTSFHAARARAKSMGIDIIWDCEVSKTVEGYYQIQGGIDYAVARSLAAAPFADLLWMETKTANLADARRFAEAIHADFPSKMLAYNLSPSFNWDTTGMSGEEMRRFPQDLGKLGFVFNFITYGGHQIDGLAAEEFATALKQDGMLSLVRLQRKFRLVESPYRTPQTLVGGPRLDAALMASSGGTAATKAMGKGSTQHQHLAQTEVPNKLLEEWLAMWTKHHQVPGSLRVGLRPHTAGSELLEITLSKTSGEKVANIIFDVIVDRRGRNILSVRDQNTFDSALRKKRLMTLNHLFLVHRYKIWSVHYVSPTDDNRYQAQKMSTHGLFSDIHDEVGDVIVADVSSDGVKALLAPDRDRLNALIQRKYPYVPVDVTAQIPQRTGRGERI